MQLLSGFTIGWAAVHALIAICMVGAYTHFRENRRHLAFAAFCTFVCVFDTARVGQILTGDEDAVLQRILIACVVLTTAMLLLMALGSPGEGDSKSGGVRRAVLGSALLLAALSISGLAHDPRAPAESLSALLRGNDLTTVHRLNPIGHFLLLAGMGYAIAAAALFYKRAGAEGSRGLLPLLLAAVLVPLGVHDMLAAGGLLHPFAFGEQSGHAMSALLLLGLLRQHESSRRALEQRVTALHRAERRVYRATDEIDKLKPMADLGKVSASLAHEIRNPLSVLGNVASSLKRIGPDYRDSERFELLVNMMLEETQRLGRLVDDLLLFSHTGRTTKETVEPESLVRLALSDVRKSLPQGSEFELHSEIEADLGTFLGSPDGLRRALFNLIDNAVQSSGGKGMVRVIARRDSASPELLMIGVEDRAGGVPQELVETIFQPFYSTRSEGTGLGLSIAENVLKAHAGALLLENRPGRGATFWMRIPSSAALRAQLQEEREEPPPLKTASAA